MFSEESSYWMALASLHRDTRSAACEMAGKLTYRGRRFQDGMMLYGIAYCMDIVDGNLTSENVYACGWARYAGQKILTHTEGPWQR